MQLVEFKLVGSSCTGKDSGNTSVALAAGKALRSVHMSAAYSLFTGASTTFFSVFNSFSSSSDVWAILAFQSSALNLPGSCWFTAGLSSAFVGLFGLPRTTVTQSFLGCIEAPFQWLCLFSAFARVNFATSAFSSCNKFFGCLWTIFCSSSSNCCSLSTPFAAGSLSLSYSAKHLDKIASSLFEPPAFPVMAPLGGWENNYVPLAHLFLLDFYTVYTEV